MRLTTMWRRLIGVFIFLIILGLVGEGDFQSELMEEQHYCERVQSGTHTHYRKEINCQKYADD